jgi:hypothetical protein
MRELESKVYDLIHEEVSNHLDELGDLLTDTKVEVLRRISDDCYDIESVTDNIFHEVHGIVMKEVIKNIGLYIGLDYEK